MGIIHSFARHNVPGDKVELPFVEFAKLCGIPSSQSSRRLRERISPSLKRIAGTVISFSRTDDKYTREYITHLVQSAYYDTERILCSYRQIPACLNCTSLTEKSFSSLRRLMPWKRRESAQALYTFIESLPWDPAPISLARLRARLNLKSPVFSQNQTVRRAMEQLREIGYLDYTEIQRGRTKFFCIHYRRPRLKAPNDESKENPLQPSPAEKVSPEMAEKLALLEKLGITLDDLENSSNPAEHKL
ncbi:RepB family plasmid replication initiator protein [Escherichia coli]|nr:RepB family plasmid replication initiator protein [Escherichia coli]